MGLLNKTGTYAKVAAQMIGKIAFYLFVGVVINWGFGLFFLFSSVSISYGLKMALLFGFFILIPFLYAWLARSYAIRLGLNEVYQSSEGLFKKAVNSITSSVVDKVEKSNDNQVHNATVNGAVGLAKQMEKLPRPLRWVLNYFLNQIPIFDALKEAGDKMEFRSENKEAIGEEVFSKIDTYIEDELLNTGSSWFWTLVFLNLGGLYACYYFFIN